MSVDPFAGVLDPFAYWDIAATYDRYAAFFDVAIYCAIFIALAHAVFVRRFSGNAGKAMATAIGLALGISLAVAGRQFGFSLRDAGPFAVLIALLLAAFLLLHTLIHLQVSWKLAVPLTYVLIYLFSRAMSPSLSAMITEKVPFINLLSVIVFLLCLWQIGSFFWPRGDGQTRAANDASFVSRLDRNDEERELKLEKRLAKKVAPQVRREAGRIVNTFEGIQKALRDNLPDWKGIAQGLSDIAHRSDEIIRAVDNIRVLDRRLRNFDWRELQQLSNYYSQLNDSDKAQLREQIQLERNKIVQEHTIDVLAERCERRHADFRRVLDDAQRACFSGNRDVVTQQIAAALGLENQQKGDLKSLQQAEKRLLDLTRLKLKKE